MHICAYFYIVLTQQDRIDMTHYNTNVDAACAMMENSSMSITELANVTGITRSQIYRWQSGEVNHMRHDSFEAVASALGYTFKYVNSLLNVAKMVDNTDDSQLIDAMQKTIDLQDREIKRLRNKIQDN